MSKEKMKVGLDLKPAQVTAGALAAVTAAYLGSKLNVAGTVAGAAVASVVSTMGAALYERSIERTRESVRKVGSKAWVVKPAKSETDAAPDTDPGVGPIEPDPDIEAVVEPKSNRVVRWQVLAVGSVLAFLLGMLAITGVELMRGAPLSGGDQGTTLGWIAGKPTDNPTGTPADTSTPPPSTTESPAATTTAPSTTSSAPTTSTESSIPTTSSAPPSTTGQSTPPTTAQTTPVPTTGP